MKAVMQRVLASLRRVVCRRCWRCGQGGEAQLGDLVRRSDGRVEHWRCIPAYVRFTGGELALYLAGEHVAVVPEGPEVEQRYRRGAIAGER